MSVVQGWGGGVVGLGEDGGGEDVGWGRGVIFGLVTEAARVVFIAHLIRYAF